MGERPEDVLRRALTMPWSDETPADYQIHRKGCDLGDCDCPYPLPALDALVAERDRLAGRLAAMADHHDAEHERCARRTLEGDSP